MRRLMSRLIIVTFFMVAGCKPQTAEFDYAPLPAPGEARPKAVESTGLTATQIVATLDQPMEPGKNVIWCASSQAAWKALESLAGGPVELEGKPPLADDLNASSDPTPTIPEGMLYTAAGWADEGIIEKIRSEIGARFPEKEPPDSDGIAQGSFVAYAYLESAIGFAIPYFQNREPLKFIGGDGKTREVSSFGIRREDEYAYDRLRSQVWPLYSTMDQSDESPEYIVALGRHSEPSQLLVALIPKMATLAETWASVQEKLNRNGKTATPRQFGINDVLLVPDTLFNITHQMKELLGRELLNPTLKQQRMDIAQQDIFFRLDRSGAELASEAKMAMLPIPTYYVFDRPFLICLRKRGEEQPYFLLWVENAELLKTFEPE